ncbi:hypothetical protein ABZ234_08170 [Nocardiopsis sp. NPDC006198]|uniref:hypothetical protein n=1 Tax=Nocardiopsis sp. NPDC006198 TaxID=3154472 RepID=UPI0033B20DEB
MQKPRWTRIEPDAFTTTWWGETFTLERYEHARWVAYRGGPTPGLDRRDNALAIATSIPKAQRAAALALNGWAYAPPLDPSDGHPLYQRLGAHVRHEDLLADLTAATDYDAPDDPLTWAVDTHPETTIRVGAYRPKGYRGQIAPFRAPGGITGFARYRETPAASGASPWLVGTAYRTEDGLVGRADVRTATGAQLVDAISHALAQTRTRTALTPA